jgi:hypothetical protein
MALNLHFTQKEPAHPHPAHPHLAKAAGSTAALARTASKVHVAPEVRLLYYKVLSALLNRSDAGAPTAHWQCCSRARWHGWSCSGPARTSGRPAYLVQQPGCTPSAGQSRLHDREPLDGRRRL